MTSRIKRALKRVSRLEDRLAEQEAEQLAKTLLLKYGVNGKAPKDEARRADMLEELGRSPLAARVRKIFDRDVIGGLTREQCHALLELLDNPEYGGQRPVSLLHFRTRSGRRSG